jgi:SPP1 family predicted phage head-tail adaptor
MGIGNMRNKLELQSTTRTSDSGGGASVAWSKVAAIYAQITPKSSDETVFADKLRQKEEHTIRVRYRSGLTTANRLVQTHRRDGVTSTRTFTIKGVLNVDNQFRFLDLDCEEGVAS